MGVLPGPPLLMTIPGGGGVRGGGRCREEPSSMRKRVRERRNGALSKSTIKMGGLEKVTEKQV